jgi:hypothetical protein
MKTKSNIKTSDKKYIVKRNGIRVSEVSYDTEQEAMTEYNHWINIIKKWPDGSQLEVVTL